jgi:hypothetical protein
MARTDALPAGFRPAVPDLPLRNRAQAARWFEAHTERIPVPAIAADGHTTASDDYLTLAVWWDQHGELPPIEKD